MAAPMEQFEIHRIIPLTVGGIDLSITNTTLAMFGAGAIIIAFFALAFRTKAVVPGRTQAVGEMLFELVDDLAASMIGHESRKFLPFVFTLFVLILAMNMLGMLLVVPTATSQLAVTVTLAAVTIVTVIAVGFLRNGLGFFKLFMPSGVPWPLLVILVPIEIISFIVRPLTLALRLFGNMIGGHVVLNVFGSFVVSLGLLALGGGVASLGFLASGVTMGGIIALITLEFVVAFLQAFVFAALACVYLNDVVNLHAH